jgi:CheY-like chemotaxis protein
MIKLLVVDDEPGLCSLLKKQFSSIGFTVLTATSGQETLSLVKKEHPKIVLLDIKMLGMSGLEVLEKIKESYPDIKVAMVTALSDPKLRQKAKELGADEFITKPFMNEELEEVVGAMVDKIIHPVSQKEGDKDAKT